jgi:hypothetical protein
MVPMRDLVIAGKCRAVCRLRDCRKILRCVGTSHRDQRWRQLDDIPDMQIGTQYQLDRYSPRPNPCRLTDHVLKRDHLGCRRLRRTDAVEDSNGLTIGDDVNACQLGRGLAVRLAASACPHPRGQPANSCGICAVSCLLSCAQPRHCLICNPAPCGDVAADKV